ncbi:MAG: hypothetical protein K6F56_01490 [Oscillospiraceae bacterium]|nr:hypothetical protein [Oscillospiraceae bacterium]
MAINRKNVKKNSYTFSEPETYRKTEAVSDYSVYGTDQITPTAQVDLVDVAVEDTYSLSGQDISSKPENSFETISIYTADTKSGGETEPVVGWLVCTKGPNKGRDFRIHAGHNYLGRVEGDIVIPNDPKISQRKQMVITYAASNRGFSVRPADGKNEDYLNGEVILAPMPLKSFDLISSGDSVFLFIALCGEKFDWNDGKNA